jgi:hypothetical protein
MYHKKLPKLSDEVLRNQPRDIVTGESVLGLTVNLLMYALYSVIATV